jgi:hypothetical protein
MLRCSCKKEQMFNISQGSFYTRELLLWLNNNKNTNNLFMQRVKPGPRGSLNLKDVLILLISFSLAISSFVLRSSSEGIQLVWKQPLELIANSGHHEKIGYISPKFNSHLWNQCNTPTNFFSRVYAKLLDLNKDGLLELVIAQEYQVIVMNNYLKVLNNRVPS